eukprot:IDg11173t1
MLQPRSALLIFWIAASLLEKMTEKYSKICMRAALFVGGTTSSSTALGGAGFVDLVVNRRYGRLLWWRLECAVTVMARIHVRNELCTESAYGSRKHCKVLIDF